MNIPEEANRRYPPDHEVDDPFGAYGVAHSDEYGYEAYANEAFIAGAEWARKETLRELIQGSWGNNE
jgi:hypothetical protein